MNMIQLHEAITILQSFAREKEGYIIIADECVHLVKSELGEIYADVNKTVNNLIGAAQNNVDDVPIDVLRAINVLTHKYNRFLELDILRLIRRNMNRCG